MSNDDEGCLEVYQRDRYAEEFRIQWVFEDLGEGATLGESVYTDRDLTKSEASDREHILATITASKTEGVKHDRHGYYWPSMSSAKAALRAIKAAWKLDTGAPWPEWAVKAQGAGWKPPKGWKP